MQIKKISSGKHANIYVFSPYQNVYDDDLKKIFEWLDTHFPDAYRLDNLYLTISPEAETFLALTFDFV